MGEQEITAFLTHLAVQKHVAPSTQNQALCAILFLYKEMLARKLDWMDDIVRAERQERIPEVLGPEQVRGLLGPLRGQHQLIARLLSGTGMRSMEGLRLRVRDVNFYFRQITVRNRKRNKDCVTVLPDSLVRSL
jgi:site-specific recombinase XerD